MKVIVYKKGRTDPWSNLHIRQDVSCTIQHLKVFSGAPKRHDVIMTSYVAQTDGKDQTKAVIVHWEEVKGHKPGVSE